MSNEDEVVAAEGREVESSAALVSEEVSHQNEFESLWGVYEPFGRLIQASLRAFHHCILQGMPQLLCVGLCEVGHCQREIDSSDLCIKLNAPIKFSSLAASLLCTFSRVKRGVIALKFRW